MNLIKIFWIIWLTIGLVSAVAYLYYSREVTAADLVWLPSLVLFGPFILIPITNEFISKIMDSLEKRVLWRRRK